MPQLRNPLDKDGRKLVQIREVQKKKKKKKTQAYFLGNIFIASPAYERESKQEYICSTIA